MLQKLPFILLTVLFVLTAIFSSSTAQFYRWTAENGGVHYSNRPPCDRNVFDKITFDECCKSAMAISEKFGVPHDIFSKIRENAAAKFPDDYSMQESYVKDQIESYKRLYPQQ